jgi:hypothetical protein
MKFAPQEGMLRYIEDSILQSVQLDQLASSYLCVKALIFLLQPHTNTLPNCFQLHKDLQVSWEIFGPQITIQLAGQVGEYHADNLGIGQWTS